MQLIGRIAIIGAMAIFTLYWLFYVTLYTYCSFERPTSPDEARGFTQARRLKRKVVYLRIWEDHLLAPRTMLGAIGVLLFVSLVAALQGLIRFQ
jgi:hypothetical protein